MVTYFNKRWKSLVLKGNLLGLVRKRNKKEVIDNTWIEIFIKDILISLNIEFEEQVYVYYINEKNQKRYFIADFIIGNKIIEVNGDYWHGNPRIFNNESLDSRQREKVKKDIYKKSKLEELGFSVHYIWEYDINNNKDLVIEYIKQKIAS